MSETVVNQVKIIKNGNVPQEIEEEEIGHEWMDTPIEEIVIGQEGEEEDNEGYVETEEHIIDLDMPLDYDDAYPSLLPIRDGIPLLTLHLPDMISKTTTFTNGEKMIQCFNKRCQRQIAFDGFLYTIAGYVSESNWNTWTCVNPMCEGSIRSSSNFQELRVRAEHSQQCIPDDCQIRLRVSIYDLRLMAEFTEIPLEVLHSGAELTYKQSLEASSKTNNPGVVLIFPSFADVKSTLEDHRINKIYRKRFEMQALKDKQRKMNMTPDEVVYAESTSGMVRFKRTKPFPPTVCIDCGEQFCSNALPSQDQLIAHILYNHSRQLVIERFEFKDINVFEQYMRELNIFSKFRMRKLCIADEHMYFLCVHDDRMNKHGNGRARRSPEHNNHCTAFIRVFDWRIVTKKENSPVTVDYCLEHHEHPVEGAPGNSKDELIDYFTPDVFLRDMEERRIRTQKIMEEGNLQRIKRPLEVRHLVPTARMKPAFGSRSLAPPLAAQLAGGNSQPYVDAFFGVDTSAESRKRFRQPIRAPIFKKPDDPPATTAVLPSQSSPQQPSQQTSQQPPQQSPSQPVTLKSTVNMMQRGRITERANFKDIYTFNAVMKIEDICMNITHRLQSCTHNRVALGYKDKLAAILRKANSDVSLSEGSTLEDVEKSWVISKGLRGRPRKRAHVEGVEGEGIEEDDEEEESESATARTTKSEEPSVEDEASTSQENPNGTTVDVDDAQSVSAVDVVAKTDVVVAAGRTSPKRERGRPRKIRESVDREVPITASISMGESRVGRPRKIPARLIE